MAKYLKKAQRDAIKLKAQEIVENDPWLAREVVSNYAGKYSYYLMKRADCDDLYTRLRALEAEANKAIKNDGKGA